MPSLSITPRFGGNTQKPSIGIIVMLLYGLSTFGWLGILAHRNQLFVMGLVWQVMVIITSATVGLFLFSEKMSSWQWVGVGVAFIAMALLMIEK